MWYQRPVPGAARPAVAIDVTPLLGARSGIGNAVGEIVTALQALEAAPPLVPYTLSLRARSMRSDVPADTRFVPWPARALAALVGALRRPAHRPLARAGRRRARDELPRAAQPAADARERLRLLVRALPGAVHARGARPRADRPPGDRPRRDGAHQLGVRRRRDRGDLRARVAQRGAARRDPARRPPARRRGAHAARARRGHRRAPRSCSPSARSNRARTSPHLVGAFGVLAADHPDLRLVIAGRDGPARPAVDARSRGCRPTHASASCSRARRRRRPPRAARARLGARVPVDLRRVRLPAARGDERRRSRGRGARGLDPRGRGRRGAARRAHRRARPRGRARARAHRRHAAAELVARGRDRLGAFSWQETARALAACYRKLAEQGA